MKVEFERNRQKTALEKAREAKQIQVINDSITVKQEKLKILEMASKARSAEEEQNYQRVEIVKIQKEEGKIRQ